MMVIVMLAVMVPNKIYAATLDVLGSDSFEDAEEENPIGSLKPIEDTKPTTTVEDKKEEEKPAPTQTTTKPATENQKLPQAGKTENTLMATAIVFLIVVAIVAYKKINYYKNV